jgi:hypothetical protein
VEDSQEGRKESFGLNERGRRAPDGMDGGDWW